MRIEKLLNCLEFENQLKLLLFLRQEKVALEGRDLSENSKVRPYIVDFIQDAKELDLPDDEVFQLLVNAQNETEVITEQVAEEEYLNQKLEQRQAQKRLLWSNYNQQNELGQRFQLRVKK